MVSSRYLTCLIAAGASPRPTSCPFGSGTTSQYNPSPAARELPLHKGAYRTARFSEQDEGYLTTIVRTGFPEYTGDLVGRGLAPAETIAISQTENGTIPRIPGSDEQ